MLFSKRKRCKDQIAELTQYYDKRVFDLTQLIEISKSLNSNLDYNNLVQSILYICMGQLRVLKAALFARKDIEHQHLHLHRSVIGFEFDFSAEEFSKMAIPEGHEILRYFQDSYKAHTYEELYAACPAVADLEMITRLEPSLIVPLRSRSIINGILLLGEPIDGELLSKESRDYALDIAHLAGIAVHNAFLYEITTTDMMTKLKLRHYFIDNLQDQMAKANRDDVPLCLLMIDIDHFKNLNDTYGHLCGDAVIKQVAKTILENVRGSDLAARYGGEEFVLLLPNTDLNSGTAIAERIRMTIADRNYEYQDQQIALTVSIGVVRFDANLDKNTHNFINRADSAMYASKHNGRNRVTVA